MSGGKHLVDVPLVGENDSPIPGVDVPCESCGRCPCATANDDCSLADVVLHAWKTYARGSSAPNIPLRALAAIGSMRRES